MRASLFFELVALYFWGNILTATDAYVKSGEKATEHCLIDTPCPTLEQGISECSEYGTVFVEKLNPFSGHIEFSRSLTMRAKEGTSRVDLEICEESSTSKNSDDASFCFIGGSYIIRDFSFIFAQDSNTPVGDFIHIIPGVYLRLENCEFKRKNLGENEVDRNLEGRLIASHDAGFGDVYFCNCALSGITSYRTLISAKCFYSYNSTFTNLTSNYDNVILSDSGFIHIVDSTFDNCVTLNGNGGALHIDRAARLIMGGYESVTEFRGCRANASRIVEDAEGFENSGRAIYPPHCHGEGYDYYCTGCGGAVYLNGFVSVDEDSVFNISNVVFNKDNENVAQIKGDCIFSIIDIIKHLWTKENVPFMKDVYANDEDFLYHYPNDEDYKIYDLKRLYNGEVNDRSGRLYMSDGGSDSNDCASAKTACYTFIHIIPSVHYNDFEIIFSANYTFNSSRAVEFNLKDRALSFEGDNDDVWVTFNGGFISADCHAGPIHWSSVNVLIDEAVDGFSNGFSDRASVLALSGSEVTLRAVKFYGKTFNAGGGDIPHIVCINADDISMSDCDFRNLRTRASVVKLNGRATDVSDCGFVSCGCDDGFGGALSISTYHDSCDLKKNLNSKFSVDGCKFIGCFARAGGAVHLNLDGFVSSIGFKNNEFNNNTLLSQNGHGYNILIESYDLPKYVTKENFPFLKDLKENSEYVCGLTRYVAHYTCPDHDDLDIEYTLFVNPVNFINGFNNVDNIFIAEDGDDLNSCASEHAACASINSLYDKYINNNHNVTITIVGNYSRARATDLIIYETLFKGFDANAILSLARSRLYLFNKTTFNKLTINFLPDSQGFSSNYPGHEHYHYIHALGSSVEFSDVTFKQEGFDELSSCLMFVYNDLKLDNCTFNITMAEVAGFDYLPAHVSSEFIHIVESGFIHIVESDFIHIVQSDFIHIVQSDFIHIVEDGHISPVCLLANDNVNKNLIINNCVFDKCSRASDGGALSLYDWSRVNRTFCVNVSSCKFKDCSSSSNGGAIYAYLGFYNNFVFSGNSFENNEANGEKNNIFVETGFYNLDFKKIFPDLSGNEAEGRLYMLKGSLEGSWSIFDILKELFKSGEYYIGDEGDDGSDCSDSNTKLCKSFDNLKKVALLKVCTVHIVGDSSYSALTESYLSCNIVGMNENPRLILSRAHYFDFCSDSSVSDLTALINDSLTVPGFCAHLGALSLSNLLFQAGKGYEAPTRSFVCIHFDARAAVSGCNFSSFDLGVYGSIIKSEGHLIVERCVFNGLTGRASGLAIRACAHEAYNLEIKGTDFINCTVIDGQGGALYCCLHEKGDCVVGGFEDRSTTFKGCRADCSLYHYHIIWDERANTGCCDRAQGGAIYLKLGDGINNVTMDNIVFGEGDVEGNRARCGYDIFMTCDNFADVLTDDNFTFLSKLSSDYEGICYDGFWSSCLNTHYHGTSLKGLKEAKQSSSGKEDNGFPWWGILLIILAVVIVIAVIVIVVVICVCRRRGGGSDSSQESKVKEMSNPAYEGSNQGGQTEQA